MRFLDDLGVFHYDGKEIPCIVEKGAPTHQTEGAIGVLYMDSISGNLYKCVAADFLSNNYDWVIVGGGDPEDIRLAVESYLTKNPIDAAGLTSTEKNLMLTLFKNIPYTGGVSAAYKSLETLWTATGDDFDDPENGGESGVTYYTVTQNLTKVTSNYSGTAVVAGAGLAMNLTPDTNAVLGEVVVTMGGLDVTASAYSSSKISISSVTGDVVITATATVASYTQVEYLETTEKTAYINTGYALQPTDLVECVFSSATEQNWCFPFAGYKDNGAMCMLSTRSDNAVGRTAYTRRGGGSYTNKNDVDPDFVLANGNENVYRFTESVPGTGTIYDANGNDLVTLTDASVSGFTAQGCVMGLFAPLRNGVPYSGSGAVVGMRIYSFKVTDVYGTAVLDLIPVLDANDVACMYDKVSDEYLYNGSTTEGSVFTAGGAV